MCLRGPIAHLLVGLAFSGIFLIDGALAAETKRGSALRASLERYGQGAEKEQDFSSLGLDGLRRLLHEQASRVRLSRLRSSLAVGQEQLRAAASETLALEAKVRGTLKQARRVTKEAWAVVAAAAPSRNRSRLVARKHAIPAKPPQAGPLSETEKLARLQASLQSISSLRDIFVAHEASASSGQKAAPGHASDAAALSEELSRPDSKVWSTLEAMVDSTEQALQLVKREGKEGRQKLMTDLERDLNVKAVEMQRVAQQVNQKQMQQNEEYLLGLLLLHRNDWSIKQQLNATESFVMGSPAIAYFYKHRDLDRPLAPQLAAAIERQDSERRRVDVQNIAKSSKPATRAVRRSSSHPMLKRRKSASLLQQQVRDQMRPRPDLGVLDLQGKGAAARLFFQLLSSLQDGDIFEGAGAM